MNDGIDYESYNNLFRPIVQKVMEIYQPKAVVLQCGANSLSGYTLHCFNLLVKGHADCVRFLRSFTVPLVLLGGRVYTIRTEVSHSFPAVGVMRFSLSIHIFLQEAAQIICRC